MKTQSNASLIQTLSRKISSNLRVAMPATIEEYDFTTQKASVQIDIKELFDNETSIDYPVISDVPVIFPRSGGASLTMPVKRGDNCLVMFLDRDLTAWALGASKKKPNSQRMHDLNDAVIVMGLNPLSTKSLATNNTDLLITYDGSSIVLKPNGAIDINSAKALNIKAENVVINCTNANIKASGEINTEAPKFKQKGDFLIEGNFEVSGSSALEGNVSCTSTIQGESIQTNSGIDLATHKHTYNEAQNGSNPTIVTPSITGGAT